MVPGTEFLLFWRQRGSYVKFFQSYIPIFLLPAFSLLYFVSWLQASWITLSRLPSLRQLSFLPLDHSNSWLPSFPIYTLPVVLALYTLLSTSGGAGFLSHASPTTCTSGTFGALSSKLLRPVSQSQPSFQFLSDISMLKYRPVFSVS